MRFFGLALLLGAFTFSSSATAQSAPTTLVDQRFRTSVVNWDGNGQTLVRWRAVIIDGNFAICGAYAARGGRKYTNLSKQAVANMSMQRSDATFMPSLRFFALHGSSAHRQDLNGYRADCRVTSIPGSSIELPTFRTKLIAQRYRTE